jgi:predicted RNA methylase
MAPDAMRFKAVALFAQCRCGIPDGMTELRDTLVEAIRLIVTRHPRLAHRIEAIAAEAQGRDPADIGHYAEWKKYQAMDCAAIFAGIYAEGRWGRDADDPHGWFSGSGSHDPAITDGYVAAIGAFAGAFAQPPSVADLGCGDFHVGARLRSAFGAYVACDVVPGLIARNQQHYAALGVDFRVLDITTDALPRADVMLVRQVLQHLSNRDIAGFVRQVAGACRWLVVTEHWPASAQFVANAIKPTGSGIRLAQNSGVVLTEPPFGLTVAAARRLYAAPEAGGLIVTMAYRLQP